MDDVTLSRRTLLLTAAGCEGGLGLLALLLGWLFGHPPLATWRWDPWDALVGVAATVPPLVAFAAVVRWPVGPLRRIRAILGEVIRLFAACTVADLALIALVAGLGEEMLFRGVAQAALSDWLGVTAGVACASVLFGLVHPITATYVVLATLIGVYLGVLWLWADNLLVVVIVHGLYDFVALLYLVRLRPRPPVGHDSDRDSAMSRSES